MKVLHFISGGDTGGAKTHVLNLLDELRKLNIDVSLICIMDGVFTQEARQMGIDVKLFLQEKRYDFSVMNKIRDYINESGADLVHCHGARANYIAMFIMKSVNIPMITTLHSDYKLDFKGNLRKQLIYTPINAIALRKFKHILTVTNAFKQMLIKRGFKAERLDVIYNGLDFEENPPAITKADFFSRFNIKFNHKTTYIGIAARLEAVKAVDVFLKASKLVHKKYPDIEFIVAGGGAELEALKKYTWDNKLTGRVHFVGQIIIPKIMNGFYQAIDINVLCSNSESFPFALLEGARVKKATIATNVGGIPEMIKDGETGCLVNKGDYSALADKMMFLIENPDIANTLGESFYEYSKEHFSLEAMGKTHYEIYNRIIKENK